MRQGSVRCEIPAPIALPLNSWCAFSSSRRQLQGWCLLYSIDCLDCHNTTSPFARIACDWLKQATMATPTKPHPPPSGAHKNCRLCDEHYWSVEAQQDMKSDIYVSLSDIQAYMALHCQLIDTKEKLKHVKSVLKSHGDLVLNRWRKYNQDKRAKLLAEASEYFFRPQPNACADPWGVGRESKKLAIWLEPTKFSHDSMQLLSLLHARTAYDPFRYPLKLGCLRVRVQQ